MSEVMVLQHVQCETLGIVEQVLQGCGLTPHYVRAFDGDEVPRRLGQAAGLVVLGGPMSAYEQTRYPFLAEEMHLIDRAVKAEVPVLGICLGSQLLAAVLGAEVHGGEAKEIGWHAVTLGELAEADPVLGAAREAAGGAAFTAFHWHGDVFAVPEGAEPLAASERTPYQAFVHGRNAYGVLFHMEVTERIVQDMVSTFEDELAGAGIEGETVLEGRDRHLHDLQHIGRAAYQAWAALVVERAG